MLPPGHASAGYIVALGVVSFFHLPPNDPSTHVFLWLGFLFGALPDLDMFFAFFKTRSWVIQNDKQSHRAYVTHTPIFWLCVASLAGGLTHSFVIFFITLCAPLSHLLLDSIQDEIRWLWPLSKKPFRMVSSKEDLALPKERFFGYWIKFLMWYIQKRTLTATLEAVLIMLFLIAVLNNLHN